MALKRKTIVLRLSNKIIIKSSKNNKMIEKIIKNNLKILNLKGCKKANILLLMLFKNEKDDDLIDSLKQLKLEKDQKFIFKLLQNDQKAWNKLEEGEIKQQLTASLNHTAGVKQLDKKSDLINFKTFFKRYEEMIRSVLNDRINNMLMSTHPYYPEIDFLNDYLLSLNDLSCFNSELLKRDFVTVNERGIRDYIK
jgi:hypothetical protein